MISIQCTVAAGTLGQIDNLAEVSAARDGNGAAVTDIDSTPDATNSDPLTDDEILNANGDEDDHDIASVTVAETPVEPIYDLALRKTVNTIGTDSPLYEGGTVVYDIEVFNQGTGDVTGVEITDYIPSNLSLADAGWTQSGSTATYNTPLSIVAGQSTVVTIEFTVNAGFVGTVDNFAEVSAVADENGDAVTDTDSTPDTGNNDPLVDDEIQNNGGDEDDHDVASIDVEAVPVFDLALRKTLNTANTNNPLYEGGTVVFNIEVFNQGNVDASGIELTDYLPGTLTLADANWTMSGSNAVYNTLLTVAAGQSTVISIQCTVAAGTLGQIDNLAEVSAARDGNGAAVTDIDSTPDATDSDPLIDDEILNANGDEDDHDIASVTVAETPVEPIYDLALRKTLNSASTDSPLNEGGTVVFVVEVFNQGTADATGIEIIDYLPSSLILNDPDWTATGSNAIYNSLIDLPAGQTTSVSITCTVAVGTIGGIENYAEISQALDENGNSFVDVDSTPDGINSDPMVNDEILNANGDEDDHDVASVIVLAPEPTVVDLALRKRLSTSTSTPIYQGATVVFEIEVFNQGANDATGVEVVDYLPAGLSLVDGNWTEAAGSATYNMPLSIAAGSSEVITISFLVDATTLGDISNFAEVVSMNDAMGDPAIDADSTPDASNDDQVIDDAVFPTVGDEDDHDIAVVTIVETPPSTFFDLALVKTVNTVDSDSPLSVGSTVVYDIQVINQGTEDASSITLVDYLPSELILIDANWTNNGDGTATYQPALSLAAGQSTTVQIEFEISLLATGTVDNYAEIAAATDSNGDTGNDIDSSADDANDDPVLDDAIDNASGDEDDHDIASFDVEVFDLALRKTVNVSFTDDPLLPGGDLAYIIEVFNQGDVDATNVLVVDYVPNGVTLADPDWTMNADGTATHNTMLSIAAGQSETLTIVFEVENGYTGPIVNFAEIAQADGPDGQTVSDTDSTPDSTNDDPVVNDEIESNPEDEDDHDRATVNVSQFDLALQKRVNELGTDSPLMIGSTVVYEIEVFNQGILDATNITVVDYIPEGLTLEDAGWTQAGNVATFGNTLSLASGESEIITVQFTVNSSASGSIVNAAEISGHAGPGGVAVLDDDSTPDDINGDDVVDDELNPDAGDEDDHDIAVVVIGEFDLALIKTIAEVSDSPVIPGSSTITYTIEVINQGDIDAYNVSVVDYLPAALGLSDQDWTLMNDAATYNNLIDVPAGQSQTITIVCTVNDGFFGEIVNAAEITAATDILGNAITDIDSNADSTIGDPVVDDVVDSSNGDEDDHDIAVISTIAPTASIDLEKWTNEQDADSPAGVDVPVIPTGAAVTWTYMVSNTGTLDLANVLVTDDLEGTVCLIDLLPAGESQTCTMTGIAQSGAYTNLGSVVGVPVDENGNPATNADGTLIPAQEAEDPSNYIGVEQPMASIVIEKSTNGADADLATGADVPVIMVGQQVDWLYEVSNTGTVDLVDVVVTDNVEGQICTIPFLPAGSDASCNYSGIAIEGDYENLGMVIGDPVDDNGNPATDSNGNLLPSPGDEDLSHYTGVTEPVAGIMIEKTTNGADADASSDTDVPVLYEGQLVTWEYTVTNTGSVDLANVTVVDDVEGQICEIALLPAGATSVCNFSALATLGNYVNIGTATGDPVDQDGNPAVDANGDPIADPVDEDPSHYVGQQVPQVAFDLEKFTNGADADGAFDADVPQLQIGDPVVWQYVVTNSGTTDLANVTIVDDMEGEVCVIPLLPANSNSVCEINGIASVNGLYTNLATATGTPVDENGNPQTDPSGQTLPDVVDEDPSHYVGLEEPSASIEIEKSTNGVDADLASDPSIPVVMVGESVNWTYEVTNTGTVDLANVVVADDIEGTICTIALLPAGMTSSCNHSGIATFGAYENIGLVVGTPVDENGNIVLDENGQPLDDVSDQDVSHYIGVDEPVASIDLEKYTNGFDADNVGIDQIPEIAEGGSVSWEYVVVNTGTVDLVDVQVLDDVEGLICVLSSLAAGETASCNHSGTAAAGLYTNIGTATGDPVDENGNPAMDSDGNLLDVAEDQDPSNYVGLTQGTASISLEKSTNGMDADNLTDSDVPVLTEGSEVIWQYLVTNTGSLDLIDLEVVDDMEGVICTIPYLPAGESSTCSYSGVAIDGFYTNIGSVSGQAVDEDGNPATDLDGNFIPEVGDEDPSNYQGVPTETASIDIEKSTNGADADYAYGVDVPQVIEGEQVLWEYVVTNTGSLDLINVQVNDNEEGVVCTIPFLAAGSNAVCDLIGTATLGLYQNLGSVTGTPVDQDGNPALDAQGNPMDDVTDEDLSHYSGIKDPAASIDIEKWTNGADADSASGNDVPVVMAGDPVTWNYVVTNNGTVDLANVIVEDDVEGIICILPLLPAGASSSCSLTGVAGSTAYENLAVVTGQPIDDNGQPALDANGVPLADPVDEDYSHYIGYEVGTASIDLEKRTNGADADSAFGADVPQIQAGAQVTWEYFVTNTGSLDLVDVTVVDDVEGAVCTIPFLPAGETSSCALTGIAIDGLYTNIATATGDPVGPSGEPAVDANGDPIPDPVDNDASNYVGQSEEVLNSLGDYVWYDEDADGEQDPDESGLPGVTVILYNAGGLPVDVTITDGDGFYNFADLEDGSYYVYFQTPDLYLLTESNQGDDDFDSDVDPETGNSDIVFLSGGMHDPSLDAGLTDIPVTPQTEDPVVLICNGSESLCTEAITTLEICPPNLTADDVITEVDVTYDCSLSTGDGCVYYTPLPGFVDVMEQMTVLVCNPVTNICQEYCYDIQVGGCTAPPVANDDVYTAQCEEVLLDVTANDVEPSQESLSVCQHGQALNGSVYLVNGQLSYIANTGFVGTDSFSYTVCNESGQQSTATVTLIVNCLEIMPVQNPVAVSDTYSVQCTEMTLNVLANDYDPNQETLSICQLGQAQNGLVTQIGNQLSYIANYGFVGFDSFTYSVCNESGLQATATVTLVANCPEIIEVQNPVAINDSYSTDCTEMTLNVLANDYDPNQQTLSICQIGQAQNGIVSQLGNQLSYVPNYGYVGFDSFTYTICNQDGLQSTATVSMQVNCEEVVVEVPYPVVLPDASSTTCGQAVTILPMQNDYSPAGQTISICDAGTANNGQVAQLGDALIYTPNAGFEGTEVITYIVCDQSGNSAAGQITITVTGCDCTNAPISTCTYPMTPVMLCPEFCNLSGSYNIVSATSTYECGLFVLPDNCIQYTPVPAFLGNDEIVVTACDQAGNCDEILIVVEVGQCDGNNPPFATLDFATAVTGPVTIDALANDGDQDNDLLSICQFSQGINGQVNQAGNSFVYTPNQGFYGTDFFSYTVCDGNGGEATSVVEITVEAPVVAECSDEMFACTDIMTPIQLCVDFCNITGPLEITNVETLYSCSLQDTQQTCFTYIPLPGFAGEEVMEVTACNSTGQCAISTVYMTVGDCGSGGFEVDIDNELEAGKAPVSESEVPCFWTETSLQLRNQWIGGLPNDNEWINVTLLLYDTQGREIFRDDQVLEKLQGRAYYDYEMLAGVQHPRPGYYRTIATSKLFVQEDRGKVGLQR